MQSMDVQKSSFISLKTILFFAVIAALLYYSTPAIALLVGILFALSLGNPFKTKTSKVSKWLLQICVVLLGFKMDLPVVLSVGIRGFFFTLVSIVGTITLGIWLGNKLKIAQRVSLLIAAGTAICGGSAIAAVSAAIAAEEAEIAVSIGVVFILNALALYLFPMIGHSLHLGQVDFGLWAGIAIHDISSVVAAAIGYGSDALQTAIAVKLSRTLWIIPLTLAVAAWYSKKQAASISGNAKVHFQMPWFIGLFLIASFFRSNFSVIASHINVISEITRVGMVLVMFLIGTSLSLKSIKQVGWKAMFSGVLLWLFISIVSLLGIYFTRSFFGT